MSNVLLPAVALAVFVVLFLPAVRNSPLWRATVTPLASIIGSGFLISGPLLTHIVAAWAPVAMFGILLVAFGIGAVIRFNIIRAEPLLAGADRSVIVITLQRVSDLALAFAYIASVAFYVHLLASFILRFGGYRDVVTENALTTMVLLFIAIVGWLRGLGGLEKMEETAVAIKLAIIAALLIGLLGFDWHWLTNNESLINPNEDLTMLERARLLAGLLLIVQGFETSRYLGNGYDASMRVRSMRLAQLIAGIIYMLFVILGLPLLLEFHGNADETVIITLVGRVALILPALLVLAAVMSQFSAAVADTVGAGGLFSELTGNRLSPRVGYVGLVLLAILLVWIGNVFEIITLASRVFAGYYLLQCLVAMTVCIVDKTESTKRRMMRMILFSLMAMLLALVVIFATPVG